MKNAVTATATAQTPTLPLIARLYKSISIMLISSSGQRARAYWEVACLPPAADTALFSSPIAAKAIATPRTKPPRQPVIDLTTSPVAILSRPSVIDLTTADQLEEVEEAESRRLEQLSSNYYAADHEFEADETIPWLIATEWPKQFASRPLDLISRFAKHPETVAVADASHDYLIGSFRGVELRSTGKDEWQLQQISQIFTSVLDHGIQTLQETPYQIRCWLKSYNPHEFFPRPFKQLQKPGTRHRYQRQWQCFLCFSFRAWRLEPALRERLFGPALDFTPYNTQMQQIWDLLDPADQTPLPLPLQGELVLHHQSQQAYAFLNKHDQPYSTQHLSEAIARSSQEHCGQRLTTASYRQVVAAIAKRHIKELVTTATATDDPAFTSIAHQFGHQPQVLDTGYGLDRSYPAKLQPELIAQYKRVSACWHQWLQLADLRDLSRNADRAAVAVVVADTIMPREPLKELSDQAYGTKKRNAEALSGSSNSTSSNRSTKRLLWNQVPCVIKQKVVATSSSNLQGSSSSSGSGSDDPSALIKAEVREWLAKEEVKRPNIEAGLKIQLEINRLIKLEIQEEEELDN
ncbi:uncharacterized protein RAG0_15989 [Rhynchosporium agropyri]|uniref:Uncharacterized protein n=1 Tax=Rhynchosporium agropyri TaxID=914238 RepID=A0A1E1LND3_9HELO|nr:uncharacterized protein RAG0_15989 [Rhynchosporium agropyri]